MREEQLWARGIAEPLILVKNLAVKKENLHLYGLNKGKPLLNIRCSDGSSLVKFKSSEEEYKLLFSDLGYVIINAVGSCMRDNWGIPQINILDFEVVENNKYYF